MDLNLGTPSVPREIFRHYDVRGNADTLLTPKVCQIMGATFGECLHEMREDLLASPVPPQGALSTHARPPAQGRPAVCISFDGRLTSPTLAHAFAAGLLSQGIDVVFLGQGTTPFLYWAEHHLDVVAGVMITGSHNPSQDNGIKFSVGRKPFYGQSLVMLWERCTSPLPHREHGRLQEVSDLQKAYVNSLALSWQSLTRSPSSLNPLLIVWDPGSGALAPLLHDLIEELPHASLVIHGTVDGTFPHRPPDPTKKGALAALQARVLEEDAHVGFAFDGDGDRLVVVDRLGNVWMGDELVVFLAEHLAAMGSGTSRVSVVADIKSSPFLLQRLTSSGVDHWVVPTGHVHLKAAMAHKNATLGGEVSGHFFFRDVHWGFDDGVYTALRVLHLLESGANLEAWRLSLGERFASLEYRIPCEDSQKEPVLSNLEGQLRENGEAFETLDGLKCHNDHGWWLVRASQTEPLLVARWEARNQEAFVILEALLFSRLAQAGAQIP